MKKKSKAKLLLWGPIIGGTILWYFVFAGVFAKIIIPWVLVLILYTVWKKSKNKDASETKPKRIRRYE